MLDRIIRWRNVGRIRVVVMRRCMLIRSGGGCDGPDCYAFIKEYALAVLYCYYCMYCMVVYCVYASLAGN